MEVELGGEGVGPVLEVIFEDDQIRLRYRDGEHDLERTTDAPAHRRERVTVIALIATNLVRDEAAALLASLEAPAPEPAAPVEPEPAPEPPEPEPPPALADPEPAPVEPPPEPALVQDAWTWPERDYLPFGIDLLPGVGFSSVYGGRERRTISLGVLGDLYGGLDGYAFAIFATIGGDVRGVQQSVGFSVAERVEGAQLGIVNIAAEGVRGLQLGGLNVAGGPVRGVQIGAINIGETADVGVGLINVYTRGQTHLELSGDSGGTFRLAVKHGVGWWHSIYALGVNPFYGETMLMAGLGFGVRAELAEIAFLDVDLSTHYAVDTRFQFGLTLLSSFQILAGIRPIDGFAIVIGLGLNVLYSDDSATPAYTAALNTGLEDVDLWPSIVLGVQAF